MPQNAEITQFISGQPLSASRIVAVDARSDIALVSTDVEPSGFVTERYRPAPRAGERIFALGLGVVVDNPKKPMLIQGTIVGLDMTSTGEEVFVVRANLHQGTSGGPVLDANGSLIGMVIGYYSDQTELGVILPSTVIDSFLQIHGVTLARSEPLARLRFTRGDFDCQCCPHPVCAVTLSYI
jgi:S1-C subfamily serine protease